MSLDGLLFSKRKRGINVGNHAHPLGIVEIENVQYRITENCKKKVDEVLK